MAGERDPHGLVCALAIEHCCVDLEGDVGVGVALNVCDCDWVEPGPNEPRDARVAEVVEREGGR